MKQWHPTASETREDPMTICRAEPVKTAMRSTVIPTAVLTSVGAAPADSFSLEVLQLNTLNRVSHSEPRVEILQFGKSARSLGGEGEAET